VRASVVKKLCALLSIDASELNHYLDFQDLPTNSWSDLAGLEVRPVISPHPVETTIFQFRVKNELGYKTYAHLADIASFEYIDEIIQGNSAPFKSPLCEVAKAAYLDRADVKKIDIGGGLIHGVAKDFIHDSSSKKILAHAASPLTQEEQSIGVNVPFGSVDVLIQASQDYEIGLAQHHLSQLYPTIDAKDMQALLSCPVVSMSPDENLLPIGLSQESIYLILRGYLELRDDQQGLRATFSAGTVAGELAALLNKPAFYNHIAASYGSALKIPAELYREIALKNNLYPERQLTEQKRLFLLACWLFEDGISYVTLNRLVNALQQIEFKKGEQFSLLSGSSIYLVKSGSVEVRRENHPIKTVSPYQFFGESAAFAGQPHHDMIEVLEDASCYRLDASILAKIPVCRWKLLQTMQRSISRSPV
jgi:hemerythrin